MTGLPRRALLLSCLLVCWSCAAIAAAADPFLVVLGVAQDAGYPQAGCRKSCCAAAWRSASRRRFATSLAVVDPESGERWLFDCTPDFREQLRLLDGVAPPQRPPSLRGILLTHAHIGHYLGLAHLGREVIGANEVPVYAMPRMRLFLETNGPWDQLVKLKQIKLQRLAAGSVVQLNDRVKVTPFPVPHRDEYSETVGFMIRGPRRVAIYLPDIDKWSRWTTRIEDLLAEADVAYLDGTFYADGELPGRDISKIPHPFIVESIERFRTLPEATRAKIRFIHLNHTNPALRDDSQATARIRRAGHRVAKQGERVEL
ncbi:MAG: MBL fold metallo-hydrolase [Pirellulaceae bacterium]|jgi:pyrroloquinoline quinone biosynthesis protein B|nr:MBL fold metallo-hydrolase [Pirellulaceae bacterium]